MEAEWTLWKNPHGHYHRSIKGGGQWEHKKEIPTKMDSKLPRLKNSKIKPTGFKIYWIIPHKRQTGTGKWIK